MNATLLVSRTQPAIGYSYAGILVDGANRHERLIVYRAFEGGRPIVCDGEHTYRAERVSAADQEPIFQFRVTDRLSPR